MKILWNRYKPANHDLNVIECGIEQFYPDLVYDYKVTNDFVIHYIEEGEGFFIVNNKKIVLRAGDGFLIRKGMDARYGCTKSKPWKYYWVGFNGEKSLEYLSRSTVLRSLAFTYPPESETPIIIKDICEIARKEQEYVSNDLLKLKKLYDLMYDLVQSFPSDYPEKNLQLSSSLQEAIIFINQHYSEKITVEDIAKDVNISRSYLYKLFLKEIFQTPQSYLINLRLFKATVLLKSTSQTIKEVAHQVGYSDPFVFSHAFKKYYGISPTLYRRSP